MKVGQTTTTRLLAITFVSALCFKFFPWRSGGILQQLPLIAWNAAGILQLTLLHVVWTGGPAEHEKDRWRGYVVGVPPCVISIAIWVTIMCMLALEYQGDRSPKMLATLFIFLGWLYAVVAIPISFLVYRDPLRDVPFAVLRAVAFFHLAGIAVFASLQ
ncbi:MAG: hypothetical protein AAF802_04240 [Planctomycetota bacterium]